MTRYPRGGKGKRWTVLELKGVPAQWRGDVLADGDGLYGDVRVSKTGAVSVRWRYNYRYGDGTHWWSCGTFPETGLDEVRRRRDDVRTQVADGIDPKLAREAQRARVRLDMEADVAEDRARRNERLRLQEMLEDWLASGVKRADGNAELRRSFEKDVFPFVGRIPLQDVTYKDLTRALSAVVDRGSPRMAEVLGADLRTAFAWAEVRQPYRRLLVEGNPARLVDMSVVLPADYDPDETRERVLLPEEIQELRKKLDDLRHTFESTEDGKRLHVPRPVRRTTELAIWICLSTLSRIGETLKAEWRHVDLETGRWFKPKSQVKGTRRKKRAQLVFLSPFALRRFRELHALTGRDGAGRFCFPASGDGAHLNEKVVTKQVGDRQATLKDRDPLARRRHDDSLVLSNGLNGDWRPHDLRRTGVTMMQGLRTPGGMPLIALDVIDRCQNHVLPGSKIRRAYMHHSYGEETAVAWRLLGEQLEALLPGL